jgi:hypothetical protein
MAAFGTHPFDRETLRGCTAPVFLGYGELTGAQEAIGVGILSRLFPDIHIRRFSRIHHFVPPEELYSNEHIAALRGLWVRATMAVPA